MTRPSGRRIKTIVNCIALLSLLGGSSMASAKVWNIAASPNLEFDTQEALLQAEPGDVVQLPAGRFTMNQERSITTPFLTLRGAGMNETTLVYGENTDGPQAIISYASQTVVEDLSVIDHPGDGVKVIGADGVTIRRVKVEWTKHGNPNNGGYGLYPVQSSNILLEDNLIIGASDAGIYVGQSHDIIVRHNRAEYNVAGIEIENSKRADVSENIVTNNTGGILVFNLPNLMIQDGRGTRIFNNFVFENNFKNFAPPGNTVATVPQGTGMLVMSNDEVEIFNNIIERHNTTSISIVNYVITKRAINDPRYDAIPEQIWIHDNVMRKAGAFALIGGNELGLVAALLSFPRKVPHITYDDTGLPDGKGGYLPADLNGERRLCIGYNEQDGGDAAYFGNMQLWKQRRWSPIPGEMNRNLSPYDCSHPPLAAVKLAEAPPLPLPDSNRPTAEEITALCDTTGGGVNWNALAVDCPKLSHYHFYSDAANPLSDPHEGGYRYDLTTPLFSDYASKDRVMFLPPGTSATYQMADTFTLPVGAVLAKTFYFPADLRDPNSSKKIVETRLLIHREKAWVGLIYKWNNQGEATLIRGGSAVDVNWIDQQGQARSNAYRIPNLAQCIACHLNGAPIGIKAGYLNRMGHGELAHDNQLEHLAAAGRLMGLPDDLQKVPRYPVWNDSSTGTLAERAKTYLDINCAHCHNPAGKGNSSGLFLNIGQADDVNSGLCKRPIAAGRGAGGSLYDIVPGNPAKSLLMYRLGSTQAAVKMPEIAKTMAHSEGLALVEEWIKSLPGTCK